MKVVINSCYGGFGLSDKAKELYLELSGEEFDKRDDRRRTNPFLIEVVETLGVYADGYCADLKIVEVPDDVLWSIDEYDGREWVAEDHRSWS